MNVLALSPHTDDAEMGAGGYLRKLIELGVKAHIAAKIGKNVWIAPQATIRNQVEIGDGAMIGMGAVVTKSVKAGAVVMGNPAREKTDK